MNNLIAAGVGAVLSLVTILGGTNALQPETTKIPASELYTYADA